MQKCHGLKKGVGQGSWAQRPTNIQTCSCPCDTFDDAEEEEEEFITSGNWRGKHNSLSRGAGADQP